MSVARTRGGAAQATEQTMIGMTGLRAARRLAAVVVLVAGLGAGAALAAEEGAKVFASPEEAAKGLLDAARSGDKSALLAVLGPQAADIVSSGDEVADKQALDRFVASATEMTRVEKDGTDKATLVFGRDDWPFPIPLVHGAAGWSFDAAAGEEEILARRIGRNELGAIDVCRAFVRAQREYASEDRDGSGLLKYAQRITSTQGKRDGLYWPPVEGEPLSPFGPLVAAAVAEGYRKTSEKPIPYHGYLYRVLTAQGPHAPGGAYDYVINGNMIGGFALIAYPVDYGNSGVMTFIVNQQGIVYQKDLGEDTAATAEKMTRYDPDSSWDKVE
jgi:hypothetical protein